MGRVASCGLRVTGILCAVALRYLRWIAPIAADPFSRSVAGVRLEILARWSKRPVTCVRGSVGGLFE